MKPRHWRLSLYDHNGDVAVYRYLLERDNIALQEVSDGTAEWQTDVPIAKLYAALALGESLTSMYVRINNCRFDDPVESEIQTADLLEDPLVRCLFSGTFATYQRAQLRLLSNNIALICATSE